MSAIRAVTSTRAVHGFSMAISNFLPEHVGWREDHTGTAPAQRPSHGMARPLSAHGFGSAGAARLENRRIGPARRRRALLGRAHGPGKEQVIGGMLCQTGLGSLQHAHLAGEKA